MLFSIMFDILFTFNVFVILKFRFDKKENFLTEIHKHKAETPT